MVGLRAEHTKETRGALTAAARSLFAERGYAATSTEDVVQAAGVTRGALYHHFRGKEELFRAVYEEVEAEQAERIAARALAAEPSAQLQVGLEIFLDGCADPGFRRIAIMDGPSVLGWEAWREIGARYGLGLIRMALEASMEAGDIERQPVDPLAHLLLGALAEAGMVIGHAEDVDAARREVGASLERLLAALQRRGEGA